MQNISPGELATPGKWQFSEAPEGVIANKWLAEAIQEAIDDPRPARSHDDVMTRMAARIARHKASKEMYA